MSVIATALKHLIEAGASKEAILAAVADMEAEMRANAANDPVAEKRRCYDRERKARKRAEAKRVSTGLPPESEDIADIAPFLDKETSPRPPKEINPTPGVVTALARKAAGFGPPTGVDLEHWNALCRQRKKPLSQIAYARICNTLAEGAEAGWPPGELVDRSIERGYETVFIPKEPRNGNAGRSGSQPRTDGFSEALREMGNVDRFAHYGNHDR